MAFGQKGGMASAHEAQPITSGAPKEVATTKTPKGQVLFGSRPGGIGGTGRGAR
jgi:hypothetical protein